MKEFDNKMNLRRTLKRVYLPALIAIILLSVSFRTAAIFADFNFGNGFFDEKLLISIASITITSGSIFLFTYAFSGSKSHKLIADFSTPATYVPTGVLTVAMMFFAVMTWIQSSATDFSIISYMSSPVPGYENVIKYVAGNMADFMLSLMAPLACLAVGYFILNACVLERSSGARAFFGIANVLFLAFYASFLYFDTTTLSRNAPNKIVDQMAFIFAALFFLYEIRISLGREKWNLYIAFGFIAAALTAYSSIPSIIVYFVNGGVVSNNIQENVLTFALFAFILSRIILAAFLREDRESESISAIREYSKERRDLIIAKKEASKKAYLELYTELNELENSEVSEPEEPIQMTLDDSIGISKISGSEYAEAELYIPEAIDNTQSSEQSDSEEAADVVQESIFFPEDRDTEEDETPKNTNSDTI